MKIMFEFSITCKPTYVKLLNINDLMNLMMINGSKYTQKNGLATVRYAYGVFK